MRFKYYMVGALAIIVVIVAYFIFRKPESAMKKFGTGAPVTTSYDTIVGENETVAATKQSPQFCPQPETLVKDGTKWVTKEHKWETYTPSSATKILNFLGAQWIGVKVGKVICLYQSNEAVSFPVALEQARGQLILEPRSASWSALVGNRKFCKSASIADCPFYIEPKKDVSDVYKEIKYAPVDRDVSF